MVCADTPHLAYDDGLTEQIIGLAIKVHRYFGPGLMESVYEACLCPELKRSGLAVARRVSLPIFYDGIKLDNGYRADAIVEKSVILEIRSVERLVPLHGSQLLTYLRVSGCRVGLLMNFNCVRLKDGRVTFVKSFLLLRERES
jgi:GxxExxY protein